MSIFGEVVDEAVNNRQQSALEKRKASFALDPTLQFKSNALFNRNQSQLRDVALNAIEIKPQVRRTFIESEIEELAQSIQDHGLMQPVTVYPIENNRYYLVCGEKRFRACSKLGKTAITAYIIDPPKNNNELIAMQIIENLHRSNPPYFEIAAAIGHLNDNGMTPDEIVTMLASHKTYVYDMLKLNKLDPKEKERFADFPKQFLLRFCQIKSRKPEAAGKLWQMAEKMPKEKIIKLAAELVKDLDKGEGDSGSSGDKPKSQDNNKIKFNIQLSELDKINPQISGKFHSYLDLHPEETAQTLAAKALVYYLEREGLDDTEDGDNNSNSQTS